MTGRSANNQNYRYGFNGKENDTDIGWQDYGIAVLYGRSNG